MIDTGELPATYLDRFGGLGRLLGEAGRVSVVRVAGQFLPVATNALGETCMATPAISDGKLYFRTRTKLIAVGGQ